MAIINTLKKIISHKTNKDITISELVFSSSSLIINVSNLEVSETLSSILDMADILLILSSSLGNCYQQFFKF